MAQPQQASPKRFDPAPRPYDASGEFDLVGKDPTRHYVIVSKTTPAVVSQYLSMGYVIEEKRKDGPTPLYSTAKDGEQIDLGDAFLMSTPQENKDRIDREGPRGNTGLKLSHAIESRIIDREKGLPDETRGIPKKYFRFDNTSSVG